MYREVGNVITKFIEENGYQCDYLACQWIELIVDMESAPSSIVHQTCLITPATRPLGSWSQAMSSLSSPWLTQESIKISLGPITGLQLPLMAKGLLSLNILCWSLKLASKCLQKGLKIPLLCNLCYDNVWKGTILFITNIILIVILILLLNYPPKHLRDPLFFRLVPIVSIQSFGLL